jgi:D-alanyl-D-alanine carboxypeptidase
MGKRMTKPMKINPAKESTKMPLSRIILMVGASLVLSTQAYTAPATGHHDIACVDEIAQEMGVSGIVLLANSDGIILNHAYYLDSLPGDAHTTDTRFNVGSMHKMFTAVAIGQLVEQGKVDFDASIRTYLPNLPEDYGPINVGHLLSHMSGVGNYFQPKNRPAINAHESVDDLVDLVLAEPLAFDAGTQWQYSNSGFVLLGSIIESVAGGSYYDYMEEYVFEAAGMTSSGHLPNDNTATPYSSMSRGRPGGPDAPLNPQALGRGMPAGGYFSTTMDLYRFAQALMNNQLVSAKTKSILTSPKPGAIRADRRTAAQSFYGYGFGITNDLSSFGHSGGGAGISTDFKVWPETGTVMITLFNLDPMLANEFNARVIEAIVFTDCLYHPGRDLFE